MPSSTNQIGNLEVVSGAVDPSFLAVLNDRLRRIGNALAGTVTSVAASSSGASATVSQVTLSVPGTLGVESDAAPSFTLPMGSSFSTAVLLVKTPPLGGNVSVQLYVAGTAWGPVLTTSSLSLTTDVSSAPFIAANQLIRLDIIAVGASLSGVSFPGADLTLELR